MGAIASKLGVQTLGDGTVIPFPINMAEQTVLCSEMTDGGGAGGTEGYIDLDDIIPAGSLVLGFLVRTLVAMDQDTSAAVQVGDGSTDDCLSGDTDPNAAAVGNFGGSPVNPDDTNTNGVPLRTAATTVRVTITSGANFTLLYAGDGQFQIQVLYVHFPFAKE